MTRKSEPSHFYCWLPLLLVILIQLLLECSLTQSKLIGNLVETEDLGPRSGGRWTVEKRCPKGSFVTGYELKSDKRFRLNSITLDCSHFDGSTAQWPTLVGSLSFTVPRPGDVIETVTMNASTHAVGFSLQRWFDQDREHFGARQFHFHGEEDIAAIFPPNATHRLVQESLCAQDFGVCGLKVRVKYGSPSEPDHITRLAFRCCYFCLPVERNETIWSVVNQGKSNPTFRQRKLNGIQVDTGRSSTFNLAHSTERNSEKQTSQTENTNVGTTLGQSTTSRRGYGRDSTFRKSISDGVSQNAQQSRNTDRGTSSSHSTGGSGSKRLLQLKGRSTTATDGSTREDAEGTTSSTTINKSTSRTAGGTTSQCNSRRNSDTVSTSVSASAGFGAFGFSASVSATAGTESTTETSSENCKTSSNSETQDYSQGSTNSRDRRVSVGTQRTDQKHEEDRTELEYHLTEQWGRESGSSFSQSQGELRAHEKRQDTTLDNSATDRVDVAEEEGQQLSRERSIQIGAQEMFQSRFTSGDSSGRTWQDSDSRMWREEWETTEEVSCEGESKCELIQTVGECGAVLVRTKVSYILHTDLEMMTPALTTAAPVVAQDDNEIFKISHPGEYWIVARNVSVWPPSMRWAEPRRCSRESVVVGDRRKVVLVGRWPVVTGIELLCSATDRNGYVTPARRIESQSGPKGSWTKWEEHPDTWAIGYRFFRGVDVKGRGFGGRYEFIYQGVPPKSSPQQNVTELTLKQVLCPENHAVCGVQTMLDSYGKGLLTNIGLRCCPHCVPEEHFRNVAVWENALPTATNKQIQAVVGTRNDTAADRTQSTSTDTSATLDSILKGFSNRIGNSSRSGFDWRNTKSSELRREQTTTIDFQCPPRSTCAYKQLVGYCGDLEVPVNHFRLVAVQEEEPVWDVGPVDTALRLRTHDSPLEVMGGHIFLSFTLVDDGSVEVGENWEPLQHCPLGSVVTSVRIRAEDQFRLSGVALRCSGLQSKWVGDGYDMVKDIKMEARDGQGEWDDWSTREEIFGETPVVGFYVDWLQREGMESLDYFYGPVYEREDSYHQISLTCPKDYQVCGMEAKLDSAQTFITHLRLQCCIHCVPTEKWTTVDSLRNTDVDDISKEVKFLSGIQDFHTPTVRKQFNLTQEVLLDGSVLKALFEARLTSEFSDEVEFNWAGTTESFWKEKTERTVKYTCRANKLCRLRQLVGVCGPLEVLTPHYDIQSKDLTSLRSRPRAA